jgi:PAS domain-containing protein
MMLSTRTIQSIIKSLCPMHQDFLKGANIPPTYTVVVDQDGKYVHVSKSFCELVGYEVRDLIGMRYDDLTAFETTDIPTT